MRRVPLPRPEGGRAGASQDLQGDLPGDLPRDLPLGETQRAIVLRARSFFPVLTALWRELTTAYDIDDRRTFNRLLGQHKALLGDIVSCQETIFRAWGIKDHDAIDCEIAAWKGSSAEETAERAREIAKLLDSAEALARDLEDLGRHNKAGILRGYAQRYAAVADPVEPPLPPFTEMRDDRAGHITTQTFWPLRLAALMVRFAAEAEGVRDARAEHARGTVGAGADAAPSETNAAAAPKEAAARDEASTRFQNEPGTRHRPDETPPARSLPARSSRAGSDQDSSLPPSSPQTGGRPQTGSRSPAGNRPVPASTSPTSATGKPHPWDGIVPPERRGAGTMSDPLFRPDPVQFTSAPNWIMPSPAARPAGNASNSAAETWRDRQRQPPPDRQQAGRPPDIKDNDDEYEWRPRGGERIGLIRVRKTMPGPF